MTDQPTDQPQPEIPGAEQMVTPPKAKKRAAKKAAAPAPEPESKTSGLYLPSLPEGYAYTELKIDGPLGSSITIAPGQEAAAGKVAVSIAANGLERTMTYDKFGTAVRTAASSAKALDARAKRLAEIEALEKTFGELA